LDTAPGRADIFQNRFLSLVPVRSDHPTYASQFRAQKPTFHTSLVHDQLIGKTGELV